jgi:hypothetical protein
MGAPSQFMVTQVESALIALLNSTMPAAYNLALHPVDPPPAAGIDIDALGGKDFDENGMLALKSPAMRVEFGGCEYNPLRDNQRLTYEAGMPFDVICFVGSLKSKASERDRTLLLVQAAVNQLAGARLALSDGTFSMPLTLTAVSKVQDRGGPVDQAFAITVLVNGIAQYNGPNGGNV